MLIVVVGVVTNSFGDRQCPVMNCAKRLGPNFILHTLARTHWLRHSRSDSYEHLSKLACRRVYKDGT